MNQRMSEKNFYQHIPPFYAIREITEAHHYHDVPEDWFIALTDVINSTQAIKNGRYREVNAVSAALIAAMLKYELDLPFVFGGDGATILIPPDIFAEACKALIATKRMATSQFNLQLRIGIMPVSHIRRDGYQLRVARLQVSENFQQAIFSGGGIIYAESLLKHPDQPYLIDDYGEFEVDYTGFECRWNEVPSPHEEVVSLIVQALRDDSASNFAVYQGVLDEIDQLYGDHDTRHPLRVKNLRIRTLPSSFQVESKVRFQDTSFQRLYRLAKGTFKARIAMWLNIQNWGIYKRLLVATSDNEKFDDILRMTIAGTAQQRESLTRYLEIHRQQGNLVYGIQVSTHALITCVIADYFGQQVHFVDGSNGGYALAASMLKRQTVTLKPIKISD